MARKKIQGITIEIGGDTTKLQTALKGVESKLKDTQVALKDVNKLLKLDPGNTELLTQKQKLLNETYDATKDKLKTLETAAEQMREQMESGADVKDEYDALQREIIETEQQLKGLTDEMKNFGSVAAQQIADAGTKVKELGDKMQNVGTNLTKHVTGPIVAVGAASVAAFNEVDDGLDIIVKKTGASGAALDDMKKRAENLATSIPTDFQTAGTAIGEVNTRFGLTGDALEELSGKFVKFASLNDTDVSASIDNVQAAMAAFDVETESAGDVLDILNKAAQDTGVDVNKLATDLTSNSTALQEMGLGINTATGFLANLNKQGVDASSVLTGMKTALKNSTKDGKNMGQAMQELMGKIKGAKSETKAMQIASELFGSKAGPAMAKAIREGRLSFEGFANVVRDWESSVDNTFEETLDPIDQFKTALNELKIVGMELVEAAAPMIKELANTLKTLFANIRSWWESLSPFAQQAVIKIAAIAAAVGPLLVVVGKVISAVGGIMGLAPQLTGIITTIKTALSGLWATLAANPILLVVAAIAALVAAFAYLWNTSEEFRNFWKNLWENIKAIANTVGDALVSAWKTVTDSAVKLWTGLRDKLVSIWDGIRSKATSVWDGITGFIRNTIENIKSFFKFEWELPKIKLPHFKIEGQFSLNPPQVPHLSIEWYRKAMENGMILTSPTVLPTSNGGYRGFGDAGPEAVVGVSSLKSMISSAVSAAMPKNAAGRNLTVIMELNGTEFARATMPFIDAETKRVGVKLAKA